MIDRRTAEIYLRESDPRKLEKLCAILTNEEKLIMQEVAEEHEFTLSLAEEHF